MLRTDMGVLQVCQVACSLCGGTEAKWVGDNCGLRVVRCVHCGLVFINPQPTAAAIQEYHAAQDLMMREGWSSYFQHSPDQLKELWDERLEDVKRWTDRRPVKLLDVGCGPGEFLHFARQRGWNATGFEFAPSVAQLAHEKYGLDVKVGDLATLKYANGGYTLLSMWHVLEHLRNPLAVLARAHELLAPGGLLVVEVPNVNCFWRRSYQYPFSAILHLFHFSPATLTALVRKAGFEVLSCRVGNTGLLCSGTLRVFVKRTLCGVTKWVDDHFGINVGNSIRLYGRRIDGACASDGAGS